ncbi:hypothetical protein [Streptomyces sp. AcH 505]|uniref:hypothetical protein n=1 Tax=Streptomyces sp. AcH 505 TaxID=352211 RepID=UPI000AA987A8
MGRAAGLTGTVPTALAVQTAVTEHAKVTEQPRLDVEMALKRAVRHPELDA